MSSARILILIALLALLGRATPSFAVGHVPLSKPFEISKISRSDSVLVLQIRAQPTPYCWDYPESLRFTMCHEVLHEFQAPDSEWCRDLDDLLTQSEMGPWDPRCDYLPQAIVRFVTLGRTSDLVVLTGKCDPERVGLVLVVPGSATEFRELRTRREDFRDMMAYALTPPPDDGSQWSGQDPPLRAPGAKDLPSEDEFVYREEEPVPVTRIEPRYPEFAREAQIQGTVTLHVLVGRSGRVTNVKVLQGVTGLNEAAVEAVKQWVFKPALSNNKPVALWLEVPIEFRLPHRVQY